MYEDDLIWQITDDEKYNGLLSVHCARGMRSGTGENMKEEKYKSLISKVEFRD